MLSCLRKKTKPRSFFFFFMNVRTRQTLSAFPILNSHYFEKLHFSFLLFFFAFWPISWNSGNQSTSPKKPLNVGGCLAAALKVTFWVGIEKGGGRRVGGCFDTRNGFLLTRRQKGRISGCVAPTKTKNTTFQVHKFWGSKLHCN